MVDIKILLNEFQKDMLQKFVDHDNKWEEKSVTRNDWSGEVPLNEEQLRNEIHYHYAKWIYNGVIKKTMPEEDTLTNLANMIFLPICYRDPQTFAAYPSEIHSAIF